MLNWLLAFGLLVTVYSDWRYRRIPNYIVAPLALLGLLLNTLTLGWLGLGNSLAGLVVGIALLFIPFVLRGVGAGDVKLLGAIGAVAGVRFVLATFLYGAAIGGVFALVVLARRGQLWTTLKNLVWNSIIGLVAGKQAFIPLRTLDSGKHWGFPYGIAMALAVVVVWYLGIPF